MSSERQIYQTGAQRNQRLPRYDLIYKGATDRLAIRCTGSPDTGGAYKYGEGNWQKGLPTSDVINHIIDHITKWQDTFRAALTGYLNKGGDPKSMMSHVQHVMQISSQNDDDLAGAMWGIMVLMYQEKTGMFHDDSFYIPGIEEPEISDTDNIYVEAATLPLDELKNLRDFITTNISLREPKPIVQEPKHDRRKRDKKRTKKTTR